jgi:hypothetical protein
MESLRVSRPPNLSLEALAASRLMEELRTLGEDEPETVADHLASETDMLEALNLALHELSEIEAMSEAIKLQQQRLAQRRARLEARGQRLRGMILSALETSGVPLPLRLPAATVSVSKARPKVHVYDPDIVPAEFWSEETVRKIDFGEITAALDHGDPVPGAVLSNGPPSLTIKRS